MKERRIYAIAALSGAVLMSIAWLGAGTAIAGLSRFLAAPFIVLFGGLGILRDGLAGSFSAQHVMAFGYFFLISLFFIRSGRIGRAVILLLALGYHVWAYQQLPFSLG